MSLKGKLAVLQRIDWCHDCQGCVIACQRNWPRHQQTPYEGLGVPPVPESPSKMLVQDGEDEHFSPHISDDEPTVVKFQRLDENPPFVKYNCWHCPSPPCVSSCRKGALQKMSDGSVYLKQFPDYPGDTAFCDPNDPICHENPLSLASRLTCVVACQRGTYPRRGLGDGVNDKVYKCTMCYGGRLPGEASMWLNGAPPLDTNGVQYPNEVPACVQACPARALIIGDAEDIIAYTKQLVPPAWDPGWGPAGLYKYPYRAGDGSWYWCSEEIFGLPTGDPYVEDHAVPIFRMMLDSRVGKAAIVPFVATCGLYALFRRRQKLAEEKAQNAS